MSIRRYLTGAAYIVALSSCNPALADGLPTLKEERQVTPACVGIRDGAEWARCMKRFKDVRPKHEPGKLMFEDWRNP